MHTWSKFISEDLRCDGLVIPMDRVTNADHT